MSKLFYNFGIELHDLENKIQCKQNLLLTEYSQNTDLIDKMRVLTCFGQKWTPAWLKAEVCSRLKHVQTGNSLNLG
jgi:hypothetical protein